MARQLNSITADQGCVALERNLAQIDDWEQRGVDHGDRRVSSAAPRYFERLAQLYFKAGTLAYQQERADDEVARLLAMAGIRAVEELEHTPRPEPSTNRDFYAMTERVLGCVVAFLDHDWRQRLCAIPLWAFHWPHDPQWVWTENTREEPRVSHGYYRLAYLRLCLRSLGAGRIEGPELQAVIRELENDPGSRDDVEEAGAGLWTLMAIADGNQGYYDQSIRKICQLHEARARRGKYSTSCEGLLFMNGFVLRQLAFEHGLTTTVVSDYLPG